MSVPTEIVERDRIEREFYASLPAVIAALTSRIEALEERTNNE